MGQPLEATSSGIQYLRTPKDRFFVFFLNHGREARLPIDIMCGPPPGLAQSQSQFARNPVSKVRWIRRSKPRGKC